MMSNYATEDCASLTYQELRGVINDAKCNGFDEAVFVGRIQMRMVLTWAFLNGYINTDPSIGIAQCEGEDRPEIEGLPVFMVNADNYFRVS
jgi:hypothetical protein